MIPVELRQLPAESLCTVCKVVKPFSEFHKDNRRKIGVRRECKVCSAALYKSWRLSNPEAYKAHTLRSNRKHGRSNHLRYTYDMSVEDYDSLVQKQNGVCAICKEPERRHPHLLVDHNHETGKVRGLLCDNCNKGLGHFKDNLGKLLKAVGYLQTYDTN